MKEINIPQEIIVQEFNKHQYINYLHPHTIKGI